MADLKTVLDLTYHVQGQKIKTKLAIKVWKDGEKEKEEEK